MHETKNCKSTGYLNWHKGFYSEKDAVKALEIIDYSDCFECSDPDEDDRFIYSSADHLLHGECTCFALALKDIFGYFPCIIERKGGVGFHAYCQKTKNGKTYYIDARGVTESFEEFMTVAREFVGDEYIVRTVTEKELKDWVSDDEYYEYALAFSTALINDYKDYYTI